MSNQLLLFKNATLIDGSHEGPQEGFHVLVEDRRIREVSDTAISAGGARVFDLRGKFLLPGLIDCHCHVTNSQLDNAKQMTLPDSLVAARSAAVMRGMLMRGFTTVRDAGGADFGLQQAVEEGSMIGPRLVICGKAISQTGGHSDYRGRYDAREVSWMAHRLGSNGRIADGITGVRMAVREEIKGGAQYIKLMANGGIASPTDPISFLQYSRDEIAAVVEEAANAQTYVAAHLYTPESIIRAVECGVSSIEHASLVSPEGAALMAEKGAMACPTLIIFDSLAKYGEKFGFPSYAVSKIGAVADAGGRALEVLYAAGVPMAYGTDLLGELHQYQSDEFLLRGRVLPAMEVIRSATSIAAKLLRMEGEVGCIRPGAYADLIVVDGDPTEDLALLTEQGKHMPLIMKAGTALKNTLN